MEMRKQILIAGPTCNTEAILAIEAQARERGYVDLKWSMEQDQWDRTIRVLMGRYEPFKIKEVKVGSDSIGIRAIGANETVQGISPGGQGHERGDRTTTIRVGVPQVECGETRESVVSTEPTEV